MYRVVFRIGLEFRVPDLGSWLSVLVPGKLGCELGRDVYQNAWGEPVRLILCKRLPLALEVVTPLGF